MTYTKTLTNWLTRINQPESWLHPKLSTLSDPSLILERDVVVKRICQAIRKGESIILFGDYDADGTGSTAILTDCIRQCGGRVSFALASRFGGGGYGFSDIACEKILQMGGSLVVTMDCGGSDHPRLRRLQEAGIDVCVVDHHTVPPEKLPALGFLNPHRPECPSLFKDFCSGGLTWSVCVGILTELGLREKIDHSQWYDIFALTAIADVVNLTGDNRVLVRQGLKTISDAKRPGIRALMEISKLTPGQPLTARDVAFRICPGVNAPGRLGPPDVIVRLLLEKDLEEARKIAQEVREIWDRRRLITEVVTDEAIKQIEDNGWANAPAIVVAAPEWGHGIVGISAARIVDKYKVPVACIGSEGRGSLRGPAGSRLYDALAYCSSTLLKWGGHQQAAGCHVSFDRLSDFRSKFAEFHSLPQTNPLHSSNSEVPLDLYLEIDPSDRIEDVEKDLYLLEPCGQGNPKPILVVHGTIKNAKEVKGGHGKFDLRLQNGKTLPCFGISRGEWLTEHVGEKVRVCGDLRKNEWKGRTTVEMFVQTVDVE